MNEIAVILFLLLAVSMPLVAVRDPITFLGLLFLVHQLWAVEASSFAGGLDLAVVTIGGATFRWSDAFAVAMIMASSIRFFSAPRPPRSIPLIAITAMFFGISLIYLALSREATLTARIGEWRTSYTFVLIPPYMLYCYKQGRGFFNIEQLLKFMWVMVVLVFVWKMMLSTSRFDTTARIISASSHLVLLTSAMALCLLKNGTIYRSAILITVTCLISLVDVHRSVWGYVCVAMIFMNVRGLVSVKPILVAVLLLLPSMALLIGAEGMDYVMSKFGFLSDVSADGTAEWRLYLWERIIADTYEDGTGRGFGTAFSVLFEKMEQFNTSPHNLYFTLMYHFGWFGVPLGIGWLVGLFLCFGLGSRSSFSIFAGAGVMALAVYFLFYSSDLITLGILCCLGTHGFHQRETSLGPEISKYAATPQPRLRVRRL